LGVPGESAWRVPSMLLPPGAGELPLDTLASADAVQLFVDRATKVRANFGLDADNAPLVHQICARLDGIPLAIELAAARVRNLSVEQLAAALDDRFRLLTGGARTVLPRQQTMRSSVEWSEQLLSPSDRLVFRRLGVFAGGFTLSSAEAVVGG